MYLKMIILDIYDFLLLSKMLGIGLTLKYVGYNFCIPYNINYIILIYYII